MHSKITQHHTFMQRCIQLARLGAGNVWPNPMVGAVLVYNNCIIGEGYHKQYGGPHAEVNCLNNVAENNKHLISRSTLYVSLEPCAHYGKTPPCADLIIRNNIPEVVIGCRDPFKQVDGKGIEKLQQAGITVITGVLEEECKHLNKRFFTFHTQLRPFVVLKWAQSCNAKIASTSERLLISNDYTNRLVHNWRSEQAAILVGSRTALLDNPSLNNRLWYGKPPVRLIIDKDLQIPASFQVYNRQQPTIIFNRHKHTLLENTKAVTVNADDILYYQITDNSSLVLQILTACYQLDIQSVLVEGGAVLLQSFIDEDCYDEANVITNERLIVQDGLSAPVLKKNILVSSEHIHTDRIDYFRRVH